MPRVLYGNFDFEHELASASRNRSKQFERLNAEMGAHLLAMADRGDHLYFPCPVPDDFLTEAVAAGFPEVGFVGLGEPFPSQAELVPWGWSNKAVEFADTHDLACAGSTVGCAAAVNSRRFSFELELEQNSEIVGSAIIDSAKRFDAAIRMAAKVLNCRVSEFDWLLKAEFSMSGRERISGTGKELSDSQRNWMARRLALNGVLFFEPRVNSLCELSTQWQVAKPDSDGRPSDPELIGITQLVVDGAGQYLGTVPVDRSAPGCWAGQDCDFSLDQTMLDQVMNSARDVVKWAQAMGYHGPIGIDSMVYRGPNGEPTLRSIQDVNARFTMGWIALEWFRQFAESDRPAWLLVPPAWLSGVAGEASPGNPAWRLTSPYVIDGKPVRRVGVLVDDEAEWQKLLSTNLRP